MTQAVFNKKGKIIENPLGLDPSDMKELSRWSYIDAQCPYCLYTGKLNDFATFNQGTKTYPNKLSRRMADCPDCENSMRIKTLMRATNQSVEEFAYWFWESVFLYKMMERVNGDKFFGRVKKWHYDDRQVFWNIYKEFKMAGSKETVAENRRAWEDYKSQYIQQEEEEGIKAGDKVTVARKCRNCGNEFEQLEEYPPAVSGVKCSECDTYYTEITEVKEDDN